MRGSRQDTPEYTDFDTSQGYVENARLKTTNQETQEGRKLPTDQVTMNGGKVPTQYSPTARWCESTSTRHSLPPEAILCRVFGRYQAA